MEWTNSKGVKWYLHYIDIIFGRGLFPRKNYYFSKRKDRGATCNIPIGYKVSETHTGMPVLKKI